MEIRIVITDAGPAKGKAASVSVEDSHGGAYAEEQQAPGAGAYSGAPSAQDRAGAIDAGPAPAAATLSTAGAPQPFVGQRVSAALGPGAGTDSSDESGGAAPGSGAGMETFTTEAKNG
jgi:hypothetical protein